MLALTLVAAGCEGTRPLWLTMRPNAGGPGSSYTMIGAIIEGDSIK
jgi:hypothetical protein